MNRLISLAILAAVCLSAVAPVQACPKCESSAYSTYYRIYAYAYSESPVYYVAYSFPKCSDTCYVPIPEPRCTISDRGLVTYKTGWCSCGCRREFRDDHRNRWRTNSEVDSMPDDIVGWLYTVTLRDGTEQSYLKEAVRKNGEWNATGRLWYYVGK